jgi:hypothetical protein
LVKPVFYSTFGLTVCRFFTKRKVAIRIYLSFVNGIKGAAYMILIVSSQKEFPFPNGVLENVKSKLRRIFRFVFTIFFINLLVFSLLSGNLAAETIPEPRQGEKALIGLFYKFDHMYFERQTNRRVYMEEWVSLGDEISQQRISLGMQYNIGKNFLLRAELIAGECYLLASQEYFKKNRPEFNNIYEKGITTLEQVIIDADRFSEGSNKIRPDIDYLPSYSHDIKVEKHRGKYIVLIHPFAGRETIGTGFKEHATIRSRRVTYDIKPYANISEFLEDLKKDPASRSRIRQISTTETARNFLSHFCPWGAQIYFSLKRSGLISNLDFRILRPYAEGLDKSLHDKLIANWDSLFSSRRSYIEIGEVSPMISDLSLSADEIPCSLKIEMESVVKDKNRKNEKKRCLEKKCVDIQMISAGNENQREALNSRNKRKLKIHVGNVGNLGNRKIRWLWVSDPVYNVWYISPIIYNWKASDYTKVMFNCYKWASGGVVWGAVSIGMDTVGGEITNEFFKYFKTSPIPVPFFSNILTEGLKDQYGSLLTGEKVLATGTIKHRKWLDAKDLFMDLTGYIFGAIENAEREIFFGKLNPEDLKMGMTYDGTQIPPVLLVGNVTGVQDVPDDDYPNYINAVRFYTMIPQNDTEIETRNVTRTVKEINGKTVTEVVTKIVPKIARKKINYDLRNKQLLGKWPKTKCIGWSGVESPFGSYEIVTSFAPKAQILRFALSDEAVRALKRLRSLQMEGQRQEVEAELWTVTPGAEKKYAKAMLTSFSYVANNDLIISLYNEDYPENFNKRDVTFSRKSHRSENNKKAFVPLKTQYELKIKVNGVYAKMREEDKYLINLYSGPRGKDTATGRNSRRKPITGTLSSSSADQGYVQLDYDRKIDITRAEAKKIDFEPGKTSKNGGNGE